MTSSLQNTQDELIRRKTEVKNLDDYATQYNVWLGESVKELGFTKEHLLQKVSKIDWLTFVHRNFDFNELLVGTFLGTPTVDLKDG